METFSRRVTSDDLGGKMYNFDFFDSFGLLLILILILLAFAFLSLPMLYWIYDLIVRKKCHIYRTTNKNEYNEFLSEFNNEKYELISVNSHYNREGKEEFVIIYRKWLKKN